MDPGQWQAQEGPQPPPEVLESPFFPEPDAFSDPPFDAALDPSADGASPPDLEYPLEYQPPPFNWNAAREISFSTFPLHDSQDERGGSLNLWIFSKTSPQEVQRYS